MKPSSKDNGFNVLADHQNKVSEGSRDPYSHPALK